MAIDPDVQVLLDDLNSRIDGPAIPDAVGDGIADDTLAIQAAVDGLSHGDLFAIPKGRYRTTAPVDFGGLRGIRIEGLGGQSANDGGYAGASIIAEGIGGFWFNTNGPLIHEGPIVEFVNFIDRSPSGDSVLVRVEDMNYWTTRNSTFRTKDPSSTTSGGVGLQIVRNAGQDNAWAMIDQCRFIGLDKGVDADGALGFVMSGGNMISHTGQTGVYLNDRCQSNKFFGTKFDGPGIGVHVDGAQFTQAFGVSFEANTVGMIVDGNQNTIMGGMFFGCPTGISLGDGVWGNAIIDPLFNSCPIGIDNFKGDNVFQGYGGVMDATRLGQAFTTGSRPAANTLAPGSIIYNQTDRLFNYSDGTVWHQVCSI